MEPAIWGTVVGGTIGVVGSIATLVISYWKEKWQHDFKSRVDLQRYQSEVRFKKVFEKGCDNLIDLAPKLARLKRQLKSLFHSDLQIGECQTTEEQYKIVATTFNDANDFVSDNRFSLPESIYTQVRGFLDLVKKTTSDFGSGLRREKRNHTDEPYKDCWAIAQSALNDIDAKYESVTQAMQTYLGTSLAE